MMSTTRTRGSTSPYGPLLGKATLVSRSSLPFGVLAPLRAPGRRVDVPAGTVLARAGEPGDAGYVVVSGIIEARRGDVVLGRSLPGEVVGELALLGGGPRRADLVAATDAVVLELDAGQLRAASERTTPVTQLLADALRSRAAA
jgi:CRP-like cAMP-binding protein